MAANWALIVPHVRIRAGDMRNSPPHYVNIRQWSEEEYLRQDLGVFSDIQPVASNHWPSSVVAWPRFLLFAENLSITKTNLPRGIRNILDAVEANPSWYRPEIELQRVIKPHIPPVLMEIITQYIGIRPTVRLYEFRKSGKHSPYSRIVLLEPNDGVYGVYECPHDLTTIVAQAFNSDPSRLSAIQIQRGYVPYRRTSHGGLSLWCCYVTPITCKQE